MEFPRLKGRAIMAPMAGITNLPFRMLCRSYGAAAVVTEMVSSNAVMQRNRPTLKIAQTAPAEKPVGLQLFGSDTVNMTGAAEFLEKSFDFIDINMGCSVRKIIKQHAGSYLMKDIGAAARLIKDMAGSISVPLTIKIRAGYGKADAPGLAAAAEKAGVAAIAIHPRMADQGFSGRADWGVIKAVKDAVGIPVIGNGDIWTPGDAVRMLDETGCDYVMIGRAAMGYPFMFKAVDHLIETGEMIEQQPEERIGDFSRYLDICREYDTLEFNDIRNKAMMFTKGMESSTHRRRELAEAKTIEEVARLMEGFMDRAKPHN